MCSTTYGGASVKVRSVVIPEPAHGCRWKIYLSNSEQIVGRHGIILGIGISNRLSSFRSTRHGGYECYCSIAFEHFVVLEGIGHMYEDLPMLLRPGVF